MLPIKRRIELTPQATQACLLAVAINPRRKKKPRSVTQLWFSASQMPLKWVSSLNQWLKSCQLRHTRKSQVFCDNTDKNKLWKRDQWKPIKKLTRAFEDLNCMKIASKLKWIKMSCSPSAKTGSDCHPPSSDDYRKMDPSTSPGVDPATICSGVVTNSFFLV